MIAVSIIAGVIAGGSALIAGLVATGTLAWAAAATAAVGAAVAAGISHLLRPRQRVGSANPAARSMVRSAVSPERHVIGRARVSGVLLFAAVRPDDEHTIDMAIGISAGAIDGVQAFYVGGTWIRTELVRTGTTAGGGREQEVTGSDEYAGQFHAFVYADGTTPAKALGNGESLRMAQPELWTQQHALPIAWAHVSMTFVADADHMWRSAHEPIEMIVDGQRLTWPGQDTPTWSNNAAIVRYWMDTELLGRTVDPTSFAAAVAICDAPAPHTGAPALTVAAADVSAAAGSQVTIAAQLAEAPQRAVTVEAQTVHPQLTLADGVDAVQAVVVGTDTEWTYDVAAVDSGDYENAIDHVFLVSPDKGCHSAQVLVRVTPT